jgi:Zn-dependent protease
MSFDVASAALWILPLLLAVVCHEVSHGWVAYRLGDDTAARSGRLTLNPLPHIDPVGTVLLPGILLLTGAPFLFGYAKPVPIGWHNLKNPARDMIWVAAAGPLMNFALAAVSAVVLAILTRTAGQIGAADPSVGQAGFAVAQPIALMALFSVRINVVLAIFNLLPVPPLDGGRVAVGLLPRNLAEPLSRVEPFGFVIVLAIVMTGGFRMLWPLIRGIEQMLLF